MATARGTLTMAIQPRGTTSDYLKNMSYGWMSNFLKSANTQIRYQIQWGGLAENSEPSKNNFSGTEGDVINIVFRVYATTQFPYPAQLSDWDNVGTIRKTRDIANRSYNSNTYLPNQRFTVDISKICQDLLSYSLVPINKGTWQSSEWGGMNGGQTKQDNVVATISDYNVTPNGMYRHIKVTANPEIILANGTIVESTANPMVFNTISIINSLAQFEKENIFYNTSYSIQKTAASASFPRAFLSLCPNFTQINSSGFSKEIRTDVESDFLYWYQRVAGNAQTNPNQNARKIRIKIDTYLQNGTAQNSFYLTDFNSNLDTVVLSTNTFFNQNQYKVCAQNISPVYANANGEDANGAALTNQIDSNTNKYSAYLEYITTNDDLSNSNTIRATEYRWYKIDRESYNNAFGFVRFYWLNRMGGIDSYTAKRNVIESISVNRSTMETRSADRTWYQDDQVGSGAAVDPANYISNTMRGGDLYKGGREVLSINAERNNSVFTEPLNKQTADWLEEILTSPNVWIEMDTEATKRGNTVNPFQRPSTKGYMPVIITNSDIETLNQETQMVKFNIEYTLSHKVQTQRN
jgi:hypothetical protein